MWLFLIVSIWLCLVLWVDIGWDWVIWIWLLFRLVWLICFWMRVLIFLELNRFLFSWLIVLVKDWILICFLWSWLVFFRFKLKWKGYYMLRFWCGLSGFLMVDCCGCGVRMNLICLGLVVILLDVCLCCLLFGLEM